MSLHLNVRTIAAAKLPKNFKVTRKAKRQTTLAKVTKAYAVLSSQLFYFLISIQCLSVYLKTHIMIVLICVYLSNDQI